MPLVHSLTINALLLNLSRTNECHETRLPSESSDGPASWNAERVSSESLGPRQRTFLLELLFAWHLSRMTLPRSKQFMVVRSHQQLGLTISIRITHTAYVCGESRHDHSCFENNFQLWHGGVVWLLLLLASDQRWSRHGALRVNESHLTHLD